MDSLCFFCFICLLVFAGMVLSLVVATLLCAWLVACAEWAWGLGGLGAWGLGGLGALVFAWAGVELVVALGFAYYFGDVVVVD